ncbi:MAG: hypothetical protein KAH54_00855 [Candidatus Sabulitectum sp.]|nr:hypothetical protein [Candidatus Sabulitectum sp.]
MKILWPELLVLVLFLLGDLLWDGFASAAAGAGAGLLAFLILLAFKKKKPGLIVEGLTFGGITALGEFVDYPGGTLLLMELVFAVILLVSVISGKDIISRMAGGFGRGLFSEQQSRVLSMTLGSVFLLHSLLCTILVLLGHFSWWVGSILFAVMYLLALRMSKAGMKSAILDSLPILIEEKDCFYCLKVDGLVTGRIQIIEEAGATSTVGISVVETEPHKFLKQLEAALKRRGTRNLTVEGWSLDEIEMEMQGFVKFDGKWRKRL